MKKHEPCYALRMDTPDATGHPTTHRELLDRFESYAAVGRELTERGLAITGMGVSRWAQSNSIPAEYWNLIATMADEAEIIGFTSCVKMLAAHAEQLEREQRDRRAAPETMGAG